MSVLYFNEKRGLLEYMVIKTVKNEHVQINIWSTRWLFIKKYSLYKKKTLHKYEYQPNFCLSILGKIMQQNSL